MRRWSLVLGGTLLVAGCSAPPPARVNIPPDALVVTIQGSTFSPASVTVPVGKSVVWVQADDQSHTVTGDSGDWDSGSLMSGATFRRVFERPGRFTYHCAIHPSMQGSVIAQ